MKKNLSWIQKLSMSPIYGLILMTLLVLSTFQFGHVGWETNDDVGLMMLIKGFGIVSDPVAHPVFTTSMLFSILQWLPDFSGIPNYSILLLATLLLAFAVIYFHYISHGEKPATIVFILSPFICYSLFHFQFTTIAGLASFAGILIAFGKPHGWRRIFAILLFFLGCIIRPREVIIIAFTFIPIFFLNLDSPNYRPLLKRLFILFSFLAFILFFDFYVLHTNPNLKKTLDFVNFKNFFTDFNLISSSALADTQKILSLSKNDVLMMSEYFFSDPQFQMDHFSRLPSLQKTWLHLEPSNFQETLIFFWTHSTSWISFLFSAVFLFSILNQKKKRSKYILFALWPLLLFMFASTALKALPPRVTFPIALGTIVFLIFELKIQRNRIFQFFYFVLICFALNRFFELAPTLTSNGQLARKDFLNLPVDRPFVAWGSALPYELIYPAFGLPPEIMNRRFYPISISSDFPEVKRTLQSRGVSYISEILDNGDVLEIVADVRQIEMLKTYCLEHFNRSLRIIDVKNYQLFSFYSVSCPLDKTSETK